MKKKLPDEQEKVQHNGENKNIYSVLIDLQGQIQIANDYLTRGDLVRLYEQLLLKI